MNRRTAPYLVFVIGLLCVAGIPASSNPQRTGPQVVPPDQRIQGKTYAEWEALWNQWVLSLPLVPGHPNVDDPAFDVTLGQSGSVWFLATPFGVLQRSISIPAGTLLFLPMLNASVSSLEEDEFFHGCSELEQRTKAEFLADLCMVGPFLEVDGVLLRTVRRHRVTSPQHQIILPFPNVLSVPAGTFTDCVSPAPPPMVGTSVVAGYYAMVRPLSRGQHTIRFGGIICGFPIDMTYHVTVF